jgi:Phage ABA sandwich domain
MTEQLTAGRELDALIAEKVMGWTDIQRAVSGYVGHPPVWNHPRVVFTSPPAYSTEIVAAWQIVEPAEFFELAYTPGVWHRNHYDKQERWMCSIVIAGQHGKTRAASAPLAICRAALKAVGYDP